MSFAASDGVTTLQDARNSSQFTDHARVLGGLINMGGSPKMTETIAELADFRDAQVGQTNP